MSAGETVEQIEGLIRRYRAERAAYEAALPELTTRTAVVANRTYVEAIDGFLAELGMLVLTQPRTPA